MTDPTRTACLAAYDRWAASYDRLDNPLVAQATEALAGRAAWLAGARVLELGCGTGRHAPACLAAGAARYVGVDASPGMLAVARRRLADPRVTWVEADATAVPAGLGPFDVVLICLVLEHFATVDGILAAAAAALAPDGRLLVLELHPGLHDAGVRAHFRAGDEEVRLPSYRHTAGELLAAAARAGLEDAAAIEHRPGPAALARSAKLARYRGRAVLLEVSATRALPRGAP